MDMTSILCFLLSQVDLCFMVDCTSSMGGSIEAVRTNVKQLRDRLDTEYKGCDIRFSFVRYTDYDQPAATRITYLDFTKLVAILWHVCFS